MEIIGIIFLILAGIAMVLTLVPSIVLLGLIIIEAIFKVNDDKYDGVDYVCFVSLIIGLVMILGLYILLGLFWVGMKLFIS